MSFFAPPFLVALAAAAGPAIIHLINRRRYRTVEWAAMDFLREALKRRRRWMEIRDLLLLLLRTLIIVLFVLAMARPYWVAEGSAAEAEGGNIHAVLVLDNSLSMGFRQVDQTHLDTGKETCREFIRRLPSGSAISVVPMCGGQEHHVRTVYHTAADAIEAIDAIELVDRDAWAGLGAELAARAAAQMPERPTKRVVFVGDLQRITWAGEQLGNLFQGIPEVQLVQVADGPRDNTWVESFRCIDGIAGTAEPSTLLARIRHEGTASRQGVRVSLRVDGTVVDDRFVDLMPGQTLELEFPYRFTVQGTSADPIFVPASVSLSADQLPGDDSRSIVVPVMAAVPVVFIDELGSAENPDGNLYGQTAPLRRLASPPGADRGGQLLEIRHRRAADVSQDDLADARLVVVAGLVEPGDALVDLLRAYAEQGGQVWIAPGGDFDPQRWNDAAWRDGLGLLPWPLTANVGRVPTATERNVPVVRLAPTSLTDPSLELQMPGADYARLVTQPVFWKHTGFDETQSDQAEAARRKAIEARREWLAANDAAEASWAEAERAGQMSSEELLRRANDRKRRQGMQPRWLKWDNPLAVDPDAVPIDEAVRRARPRVMARYDDGAAWAVRQPVGRGQIVWLTSGLLPKWNSIAAIPAVALYDRLMRELITDSLPDRTLGPVNEIVIPVEPGDLAASFSVLEPDGDTPRPLNVEALETQAGESYALILRDVFWRGVYTIRRADPANGAAPDWAMQLAVNGPAEESQLTAIDTETLEASLEPVHVRMVGPGKPIDLSGQTIAGGSLWRWLILAMLLGIALEMLMLRTSAPRRRAVAKGAAA